MSKYVEMREKPAKGKTRIFQVFSKDGELPNFNTGEIKLGHFLGEIKWFGPWRRYCLFPTVNTVWDSKCLPEVNKFIDDLMRARANLKKALKEQNEKNN